MTQNTSGLKTDRIQIHAKGGPTTARMAGVSGIQHRRSMGMVEVIDE
jgi:hypothetical protein